MLCGLFVNDSANLIDALHSTSAVRYRVPVEFRVMQRCPTEVSPRDAGRVKALYQEWRCCSSVDPPETLSLRVPHNGKPHWVDADSSENRSLRDTAVIGHIRRLRLNFLFSVIQLSR